MKNQFLAFFLILIAFNLQAQDKMDHSKMKHQTENSVSYDAPQDFQAQLANVYEASLNLKEAFVASEAAQVKKAASPLQEALSQVDMKLLKDKAHMAWMEQLKILNSSLKTITEANAINFQRQSFADFNQALYRSIKSFGIGGEEAYYQFCPMANDNQGAYWLSDSEEIRNPYFGDKMLTCGSVKEELN